MNNTKSKYHLILVTKYRKKILTTDIMGFVIGVLREQLTKMHVDIIAINGDEQDHIHLMIETRPTQSISLIVRVLKQMTSYHTWRKFPAQLRKFYWYQNLFWSSGYFCCTTGDTSSETIKKYIENQGN